MSGVLKNQLAECRAVSKMKKSQLAHYLKKSRAYVTRLERGDIRPSFEVALRIARHFHKPVEEIFQLSDCNCQVARPTKGLEASVQISHKSDFPSVVGNVRESTSTPTERKVKTNEHQSSNH